MLEGCLVLARSGSADAAFKIAEYYDKIKRRDPREAISWYERAAELGDLPSLRRLFDAYLSGSDIPKNVDRAEHHLARAIAAGAEWAQLIDARRKERADPGSALGAYLRVARNGNCFAQARVARAYLDGDLAPRSIAQAYFWTLLADVGGAGRVSDYHPLADLTDARLAVAVARNSCAGAAKPSLSELESRLSEAVVRQAQNEALQWRAGQQEVMLSPESVAPDRAPMPRPSATETTRPAEAIERLTPRSRVPGRSPEGFPRPATTWQPPPWRPAPREAQLAAIRSTKDTTSLFEGASRAIWLVAASKSKEDLERRANVVQGSGVAITRRHLLTNCHLLENRPVVVIKQGSVMEPVSVVAADLGSDRCILATARETLTPVQSMRSFNDLKVGEPVYTIGSPAGLETTLGQGLISGLRRLERRRLVQNTAQIFPGSSGGGLFDQFGNLIGITSFRMLRDSQGLNFAIAVDDYFAE